MDSESELSLEFKPSFNPKRLIEFLREIRLIGDRKKKLSKLAEYICCLEEELRKIDAFKRELPLCMLLMQDAIGVLRDEEMHCGKLVLEEFMLPVKRKINEDGGVKREKDCSDKMNWMTSAQLWSVGYNNNNDNTNNNKNKSTDVKEKEEESIRTAYEYSFPGCKYSNEGGAFTPFKGILSEVVLPLPDLSLMSSGMKKLSTDSDLNLESSSKPLNPATTQSNSQPRKARRCWSPELHSRFVNALHQLGGLQVATPKQIRELMKDDGLTNDEVKSHLQKYRLHTRRLSGTESNSQSRSPESPFQLTGTDCEDDDGKSEIWQ